MDMLVNGIKLKQLSNKLNAIRTKVNLLENNEIKKEFTCKLDRFEYRLDALKCRLDVLKERFEMLDEATNDIINAVYDLTDVINYFVDKDSKEDDDSLDYIE